MLAPAGAFFALRGDPRGAAVCRWFVGSEMFRDAMPDLTLACAAGLRRLGDTDVWTEAVRLVREEAETRLDEGEIGKAYLPEKPNVYRKKGRAQDAHEAIRPTAVRRSPDSVARFLTPDQLKLYRLIWRRFVASQMRPQELDITTVDAEVGEAVFRATGRVVAFDGFTQFFHVFKAHGLRKFIIDFWLGRSTDFFDIHIELSRFPREVLDIIIVWKMPFNDQLITSLRAN